MSDFGGEFQFLLGRMLNASSPGKDHQSDIHFYHVGFWDSGFGLDLRVLGSFEVCTPAGYVFVCLGMT